MNDSPSSTCIAGLDLALKWARFKADLDLARCTAGVAQSCCLRRACPRREDCDERLHAIDRLLRQPEEAAALPFRQ